MLGDPNRNGQGGLERNSWLQVGAAHDSLSVTVVEGDHRLRPGNESRLERLMTDAPEKKPTALSTPSPTF